MKFRKKPVMVEAFQWTGANTTALLHWMFPDIEQDSEANCLTIKTLEGEMKASPGDWIIRGVNGEFYPCKPDIFAATYEPVGPKPPKADAVTAARRRVVKDAIDLVCGEGNRDTAMIALEESVAALRQADPSQCHPRFDESEISQCPSCLCMTHTVGGNCGKCGKGKGE